MASWTHTALAQQIVFGPGAVERLPELLRTTGARRALLVTTAGRLASPDGERIVSLLGRSLSSTFSDVSSHVPAPTVQAALLQARRDAADAVVSFGGGSCADLGKAVCFFLEHEAGMPGASHVDRPMLPHISVPTTYSGAELTPFFGMTDPGTGQKQGAGGPTSAPLGVARDRDVDSVVSFGGGSCADLGKAVCFFVEQEAGTPGASYVDRPSLPHVSIPTTYAGAELTPFFGMTDENTKRKSGGGGPTIAPIAAVYDPTLALDTPVDVSAQTGMNALAHGIECAYSPARTPEAEAVALACIERVAQALPWVVEEPDNLVARGRMFEGAALGGRCLQNASMGVHHGLAQLLGGRTGIPHGLANALLLAHVVRFNTDAVPGELRRVGLALGDADDPAGAVDALRERLGLPGRLSDCGVTDEDVDAVSRMAEGNPNVRANPRPVSEQDAREILEAAF